MRPWIFLSLILSGIIACKPGNKPQQEATTTTEVPASGNDSLDIKPIDTSMLATDPSKEGPPATPPARPAVPKVCDPDFTKISTVAKNHHIVYVSNFKQEEFKCWVLLEEYGNQLCHGAKCVVYYVDKGDIKIDPALPHHMSDETLKSAGVGRFEYNGKYWEIKGASQWKRQGKGYGYYNTDNQLGG